MAATKSKAKKNSRSTAPKTRAAGDSRSASSRGASDTRRKSSAGGAAKSGETRHKSSGAVRGRAAGTAGKKAAASRSAESSRSRAGAEKRVASARTPAKKTESTRSRTGAAKKTVTRAKPAASRSRTAGKAAGADAQFLRKYRNKLSAATLRAKWIGSPDDHADRPGQTLATRNHDVIRQWAEERRGQPATVPSTRHGGRAGVLRIDFPGFGGDRLEPISWEEWFQPFDERDLVFVYQERMKAGNQSNFFRLDNPNREDA